RHGGPMDAVDLKSMPSDELWKLHEAVTAQLGTKLAVEKAKLAEREKRLRKLLESLDATGSDRVRIRRMSGAVALAAVLLQNLPHPFCYCPAIGASLAWRGG